MNRDLRNLRDLQYPSRGFIGEFSITGRAPVVEVPMVEKVPTSRCLEVGFPRTFRRLPDSRSDGGRENVAVSRLFRRTCQRGALRSFAPLPCVSNLTHFHDDTTARSSASGDGSRSKRLASGRSDGNRWSQGMGTGKST